MATGRPAITLDSLIGDVFGYGYQKHFDAHFNEDNDVFTHVRLRNILMMSDEDILNIKGIGTKSFNEIMEKIDQIYKAELTWPCEKCGTQL